MDDLLKAEMRYLDEDGMYGTTEAYIFALKAALKASSGDVARLTAENARLRKDRDRFECDFVDAKADFGGMMAEANKRVDAALARAEKAERERDATDAKLSAIKTTLQRYVSAEMLDDGTLTENGKAYDEALGVVENICD